MDLLNASLYLNMVLILLCGSYAWSKFKVRNKDIETENLIRKTKRTYLDLIEKDLKEIETIHVKEGKLLLSCRLDLDREYPSVLFDISETYLKTCLVMYELKGEPQITSEYKRFYYVDHTYDQFLKFIIKDYFGADEEEFEEFIELGFIKELEKEVSDKFVGGLARYKNVNV